MTILTVDTVAPTIFAIGFVFCAILSCAMAVWAAIRGTVDKPEED